MAIWFRSAVVFTSARVRLSVSNRNRYPSEYSCGVSTFRLNSSSHCWMIGVIVSCRNSSISCSTPPGAASV